MKHGFKFIHYYTMNLETSILKIIDQNGTINMQRQLPFTKPTRENRQREDVRPIFWQNNTKSYINRTSTWDNFPNGRWGSSFSPAFKAEEEGFVSFAQKPTNAEKVEKIKIWGETLQNLSDVSGVFVKYVTREIKKFPFSEGPLQVESNHICDMLKTLNENLLLTINSQPVVNGVKSSDPIFGWGPTTGYVYQKAYYEFFIPKCLLSKFVEHLNAFPTITYQAANSSGHTVTNVQPNTVNAVTWGIFMNHEVSQPTVVDYNAFMIWKDEAFQRWLKWANIYESDSVSAATLQNVHDNFYLMNVVENDYIGGNLNQVVFEFIIKNSKMIHELKEAGLSTQ